MRLLLFLALSGVVHALLLRTEPAALAPPLLAVASPQKKLQLALTVPAAKKQPVQKEEKPSAPPPAPAPEPTPAPAPARSKQKKVTPANSAKQVPADKKKKPEAPVPPPEAYQSTPVEPRMVDPAEYLNNPPPAYPRLARRRGHEGTVVLSVLVNQRGGVHHVEVKESSGHSDLDEEALRAVASWRFVAATREGKPVSSRVLVPVRFELQKK